MTDLASAFIDFDDDVNMMQFPGTTSAAIPPAAVHSGGFVVSEDDQSMSSEAAAPPPPDRPTQVDWDWATRAMSPVMESLPAASSGFLNCWREGPLPDLLNLNDDLASIVPPPSSSTFASASDDDTPAANEVKRSPRSASSTNRRWTVAEIQALKDGVAQYGTGNWKAIQKDAKYAPFLGDRVRSSLHRKWSRLKAKTADRDARQIVAKTVNSAPQDIRSPGAPDTKPSSHVGSWSFESSSSARGQYRGGAMASSLPPFHWNPAERPPPSRTSSVPIGFQNQPVQMAVCVDPTAPPQSPFVHPASPYVARTRSPSAPQITTSAPVMIPQNRSRRWTPAQAQTLVQAVSVHGESKWREILMDEKFASFFAGRSPQSLVRKWARINNTATATKPQQWPDSQPSPSSSLHPLPGDDLDSPDLYLPSSYPTL